MSEEDNQTDSDVNEEGQDGENPAGDVSLLLSKEKLKALVLWASTSLTFLVIAGAVILVLGWMSLQKPRLPNVVIYEDFKAEFNEFVIHNPPVKFPADLIFYDLNGNTQTISDTNGRYRLINFWATWCAPCIDEIPGLLNLDDRWQNRGLDVKFVSLDFPDSPQELRLKMKNLSLPPIDSLYVKDYDVWKALGLVGLPTTILVSPRGYMYYTMAGDTNWMKNNARRFVQSIVKK